MISQMIHLIEVDEEGVYAAKLCVGDRMIGWYPPPKCARLADSTDLKRPRFHETRLKLEARGTQV